MFLQQPGQLLPSVKCSINGLPPKKWTQKKGESGKLNGKESEGMRDKQYRTYTAEFKREALELLKSSGKSASQLERELRDHARDAVEMAQPVPGGDDGEE